MKVIKLQSINPIKYTVEKPTEALIRNEHDYLVAEKLTKKLLEKGLITKSEFDKIMAKNLATFSPFLAEIML